MLSIQTLKDSLDQIKIDLNMCSSYPAPQQSTYGIYSSDIIRSDTEQVAELCPYKLKIVTRRLLSLAHEAHNLSLNLLKSQQQEVPLRFFVQALMWSLKELDGHLDRHTQSTNGNRWAELIAFVEKTGDDQERFTGEESEQVAKIHQYAIKILAFCDPPLDELLAVKVLHPVLIASLLVLKQKLHHRVADIACGYQVHSSRLHSILIDPDFELIRK